MSPPNSMMIAYLTNTHNLVMPFLRMPWNVNYLGDKGRNERRHPYHGSARHELCLEEWFWGAHLETRKNKVNKKHWSPLLDHRQWTKSVLNAANDLESQAKKNSNSEHWHIYRIIEVSYRAFSENSSHCFGKKLRNTIEINYNNG